MELYFFSQKTDHIFVRFILIHYWMFNEFYLIVIRHTSNPCLELILAVLFLYLHEMISQSLKIDSFCVRSFVFWLFHVSI